MADKERSPVVVVKEYFSTEEKPVTNAELIELKKSDPGGNLLTRMADGITDGTFTY